MTTHALRGDHAGSDTIERYAREHPGVVSFARIGWAAKGLVYVVLGALAVPIALASSGRDDAGSSGSGSDQASQSGAIARLAESAPGAVALWVVAVGLVLYVVWRVVSILLPAENTAKAWVTRIGYGVSVVMYTSLALTAVSFARSGSSSSGDAGDEDARIERLTADWMQHGLGRWLIGIAGLAVIAIGIAFVYRGVTADFDKELESDGVGPISHHAILVLGRIGWVGRGLMMGVVGWFLFRAATDERPEEAQGIDGALRAATSSGLGRALVWVVALGLIVYGIYCIVSAPRQRLRGAD